MAPSDVGSSRRKVPERSDRAPSLPHDHNREARQPYAREVEDYKHGVAAPPQEQVGREPNRGTPRGRTS
jgi:hypothetical protein